MSDHSKRRIFFMGKWIDVSEDVYRAYYRGWEKVKYLRKVDRVHCRHSYEALCEEDNDGEDISVDPAPTLEEQLLKKEQIELLHRCLDMLPSWDRDLIHALYYDRKTERQYAAEIGMSKSGVHNRREQILAKLKSLMNVLEKPEG